MYKVFGTLRATKSVAQNECPIAKPIALYLSAYPGYFTLPTMLVWSFFALIIPMLFTKLCGTSTILTTVTANG